MPSYVLDASVLAKLALNEPGAPEFQRWNQENAGEEMRAPSLAFSEVGRLLQKAKARPDPAGLARLQDEVLEDIALDAATTADAPGIWKVAQELSFYDAEYVRLAQRLGAVLVTADKKMADRARKAGVQVKEF